METFLQLTWNGLVHGTTYALLGMSFGLILSVSFRFHTAYQVTYTLGAFVAAGLGNALVAYPLFAQGVAGPPAIPGGALQFAVFPLSMLAACIVAAIFGVVIELVVYQPLAKKAGSNTLLIVFVASLGVTILTVNLISLFSPGATIAGFTDNFHQVGPVTITNLQITQFIVSWIVILGVGTMLASTSLGRMIRAVAVNPEMAMSVGVDPKRIFIIVFAIGSFMSAIPAVFNATLTAATPDFGTQPFFYALVVAFVASLASNPQMILYVGVGLGLLEAFITSVMPTQLSPMIVFVILFIYVALRPVDFAALRRKYAPKPAVRG